MAHTQLSDVIDRQQNLEKTNMKLREGTHEVTFYSKSFSYSSMITVKVLFHFIWKQVKTRLEEFSYSEDRYRALLAIRQYQAFCLKYNSFRHSSELLQMLIYSKRNDDIAWQKYWCWGGCWWQWMLIMPKMLTMVLSGENTMLVQVGGHYSAGGRTWAYMSQQKCWSTEASYQRRRKTQSFRFLFCSSHYSLDRGRKREGGE